MSELTNQNSTTIHIRVDKDTKIQAEELFKSMGLSISTAVNMFIKQSLADSAIPFQPKAQSRPRPIKTLKERLEGFEGVYDYEEWETGPSVGSEIINDIYS